ncbi:cation diffusion facilitator family transporter [Mesohalobacter halotolerans]|uniref:Cation transporter n=1 Tax=Mesohalobacter halotolerans TaxID=1883405 RepID=A0A4U5TT01_9FLAO|nr:cation diffusion facilitator family transporter [Mesohalobacter halotolerans]MBS3738282.1 cation transporter [Psychroflexus sp.]NBC59080.1 cation diffusion facilitator family transporter [Bacteroidota bacterium]TKS57162.1 cation transporter [Mesohalobacter halotolerans]
MGHHHFHTKPSHSGKILITIFLNIGITIAQVIGGLISGSLALLSDALHNFTDVVSLIISYVASVFASKEASTQRTFGYKRAEILAAFVNAASLVVIAIILIIEAIERFFSPHHIESDLVIILSLVAILGNGFSVLLLKKDSGKNMNMRSAYLHLLSDLLASIAVLVGGILMKYYQTYWIDSLLTLAIALYLIYMSVDLLKRSYRVLMLFTPTHLNVKDIVNHINDIEGVALLHHVHVWQLNEDEVHLEAHLDFEDNLKISEFDQVLEEIEDLLKSKYNINHVTIQPEYNKRDPKDIIVQD